MGNYWRGITDRKITNILIFSFQLSFCWAVRILIVHFLFYFYLPQIFCFTRRQVTIKKKNQFDQHSKTLDRKRWFKSENGKWFSVKGQIVYILAFVRNKVFVAPIHLCHHSMKAAVYNMQMQVNVVCFPKTLRFEK